MNPLRYFAIAVILLLLFACASTPKKSVVASIPKYLESRSWLHELPPGEYMIGISYPDEHFPENSEAMGKAFAAIALSRNHSAFVVDKELLLTLADNKEIDYTSVKYNVVVSSDMEYLNKAANELTLLDSLSVNGIMFSLYAFSPQAVSKKSTQYNPNALPEWTKASSITIQNNKLVSRAMAHEAELSDAFFNAQENALSQIGQYRIQNVMAEIRDIDDVHRRVMAIETVTKTAPSRLSKIHIVPWQSGEFNSYTVYLELETTP